MVLSEPGSPASALVGLPRSVGSEGREKRPLGRPVSCFPVFRSLPMNRRLVIALAFGAAMVLAGASRVQAFSFFDGGCGCAAESSCCAAPSCGCESSCGCGHHRCHHRHHGCGCESSCGCAAPTCGCAAAAPAAPSCGCAAAPSCGCESSCGCGHHRCHHRHHGCGCESSCGCAAAAPSCGCAAPSCGCESSCGGCCHHHAFQHWLHACCKRTCCGCEASCGCAAAAPSCGCAK